MHRCAISLRNPRFVAEAPFLVFDSSDCSGDWWVVVFAQAVNVSFLFLFGQFYVSNYLCVGHRSCRGHERVHVLVAATAPQQMLMTVALTYALLRTTRFALPGRTSVLRATRRSSSHGVMRSRRRRRHQLQRARIIGEASVANCFAFPP